MLLVRFVGDFLTVWILWMKHCATFFIQSHEILTGKKSGFLFLPLRFDSRFRIQSFNNRLGVKSGIHPLNVVEQTPRIPDLRKFGIHLRKGLTIGNKRTESD